MRLALRGLTALRALREFRRAGGRMPDTRVELPDSDPSPQQRWTPRLIPLERLALDDPPTMDAPIEVVVPTPRRRLQASFFSCRVQPRRLPRLAFVDLGDGLLVPCPELLFLQLSEVLMPEVLSLLGYELCGSYVRDPRDPRCGPVAYDVEPVTTVEKIAGFLGECGEFKGVLEARRSLDLVADNSWSALESVIALLASLPIYECGYGFGRVRLNVRHAAGPELVSLGQKGSRVPDIEVVGTHVGFNYDGHDHFDLKSIADAALRGGAEEAIRAVHKKYRDDVKRNRELAAAGRLILPVTSQDLFERGGLDAVMLEAALAMREFDGVSPTTVLMALHDKRYSVRRQILIWALLPWEWGDVYARRHMEYRPWHPIPSLEIVRTVTEVPKNHQGIYGI